MVTTLKKNFQETEEILKKIYKLKKELYELQHERSILLHERSDKFGIGF